MWWGDEKPDFWLRSGETRELLVEPHACARVRRIQSETRDDLLLVWIDRLLIGQQFGLGARDVDELILVPRHRGVSLFPITEWPVFVHVLLLRTPSAHRLVVRNDELHNIAWAELYETEADARTGWWGKGNS